MNPRQSMCRNRCGARVYRLTDHIGRERQIDATPYTGAPPRPVGDLWYFRSRWAGWIPYEHATKGAEGKPLHAEHSCG